MLVSIIAKGLALIDALITEWAIIVGTVPTSTGNCYNLAVYNVQLTACGAEFIHSHFIEEMIDLAMSPLMLAGWFAV